jgi:hypothetical protein
MDTKTKILSGLVTIFAITAIVFGSLFFVGCNTFKVVKIEGQPEECNHYYTTLSFYASLEKGKSDAFIGTVYNDCSQATQKKRNDKKIMDCKELWFGKETPLDKAKFDKYTGFLECAKEK